VWPEQAAAAPGADDRDELTKGVDGTIQIAPSNPGPVEIHLELMTAAEMWIIAAKPWPVLSLRMAMRECCTDTGDGNR
jgi:hypothetical protein